VLWEGAKPGADDDEVGPIIFAVLVSNQSWLWSVERDCVGESNGLKSCGGGAVVIGTDGHIEQMAITTVPKFVLVGIQFVSQDTMLSGPYG